jgi:BMFP domain-containing protein YqiC
MNTQSKEELAERLRALLAQGPAADLDRNLRALLGHWFTRLDLVSREEFDIQREVLARTRARVAELERQLAALEASARHPR